MIKWPKSVKFGQKAPFFMPQLKIKVGDLYQFHLFFKEGVVICNLIVFQEAVVISSYLNFNKIWKKCHFPIKAHAKSAFFGYLNVIVCTAKTRSMTYWFFCLIWVRRWSTLQRSDLYTSVVIHKWDQHTSLSHNLSLHMKKYKQNDLCTHYIDLDQPGHLPSLISLHCPLEKTWVLSYLLSAQQRLIRLGRCPGWSESSLGGWFCHVSAHLVIIRFCIWC